MSTWGSIADASRSIRAGDLRSAELVESCLDRIERHDRKISAWAGVDRQGARESAGRLDEELAQGNWRGPLHGIPVGIKDIIDVAGMPTVAGSPLRAGHVAARDASVVAQLRRAGAIILGKTVTTEFACFDPSPTRNPWNLSRTPGGSSSGSAAAVATLMCLGAIGTQTGGSITRPASYCGVAGCKPTRGRVSRQGVIPVSPSLDHVGPIARSAGDLAILLAAICAPDTEDRAYAEAEARWANESGAGVPRLGLLASWLAEADESVRQVTQRAVDRLKAARASITEVRLPVDFDDVRRRHRLIMAVEAAHYHRSQFAAHRQQYGPNLAALIDEGLGASEVDYQAALAHQHRFEQEISAYVGQWDAVITPATPSTAPGLETTGDPRFNSPWSYCGLPTVSIPCGLAADGLPVAIQMVGPAWQEFQLLAAAAWCERQIRFSAEPPIA